MRLRGRGWAKSAKTLLENRLGNEKNTKCWCHNRSVQVLLVSTYEMGRQPFGLASPAAWLRAAGHDVTQADVSVTPMPSHAVETAGLIAFFLPMHTATKLFLRLVDRVRAVNPRAHLCAYGLYAPLNERLLRGAGVGTILGGEFESGLCELAARLSGETETGASKLPVISTGRQQFLVPDRQGLPPLGAYAQLVVRDGTRRVGYTEASRGCKHLCRHCPVVPVYRGLFRVVQPEIVLEDIRRQVAAGAAHITFGDPDFFNGPGHAIPIVEALHEEWPWLSYDVTIKVSHLLKHRDLLPILKRTNCAFVTSAIESLDDTVLAKLDKGHTRGDFLESVALMRDRVAARADVHPVPPVDDDGELSRLSAHAGGTRLTHADYADPTGDPAADTRRLAADGIARGSQARQVYSIRARCITRGAIRTPRWTRCAAGFRRRSSGKRSGARLAPRFSAQIWDLAEAGEFPDLPLLSRATIPYLTEPWYC